MAIPGEVAAAGMEALNRLKSTDPPLWLAPSPSLSQTARTACKHLFSSISPHVPKSPFDQLLIDGFDAEQIWQQIDLQSQPLLSSLRRQVLHFEKNPEEIRVIGDKVLLGKKKDVEDEELKKTDRVGNGDDDDDDDDIDMYEIDDEDDGDDDDEEEEERGEEEEGSEEEESEEEGEKGVIEDKFLKIKELEDFLEEEDAKEYGLDTKKNNKRTNLSEEEDEDEEDDEDDEEEGEEDEEDDEVMYA